MREDAEFDKQVRLRLYGFFVDEGRPPVPTELAAELGAAVHEVEAALQRLHDGHVLVLVPGSTYVWMANPLSAIPTPFPVEAGGRTWFGNCIWDALGVVALLGGGGRVRTWCPDCGHPMALAVEDGEVRGDGIIHFAVPAARWWDDIGFT